MKELKIIKIYSILVDLLTHYLLTHYNVLPLMHESLSDLVNRFDIFLRNSQVFHFQFRDEIIEIVCFAIDGCNTMIDSQWLLFQTAAG